ncbi:MAG: carboxypeptidase regulatory-like domain-containing protein [Candidatus Sericytochromatia bacterium]|nr:carboxypeptidase regulatory-like domain-containing protein [Candidatus Sericytochromatia bacterium]
MLTRGTQVVMAAICLAAVAGCGQLPGRTGVAADAAITGTVVKSAQPLPGATVVLLKKVGNEYRTSATGRTDSIGAYRFNNVTSGLYRVAFDLATPSERREVGRTVLYTPGVDTYGYLSTDPFYLELGRPRQTPQLDVAWDANLQPAPDAAVSAPVAMRWHAGAGARRYRVRITDAHNNTLVTSPRLGPTKTGFTWDGKVADQRAAAGTYYWSVNADTPQGFGGTNVSPFTLR